MKTLLVVGASSDIGSALIQDIADHYEVIWAHYAHWNEKLEEIKEAHGSKIRFLQADLLNLTDVESMIAEIKNAKLEPDHIVHFPALKACSCRFSKTPWDNFQNGWELSLHSAVMVLQAFLPHMQKQKYGKIVFMLTSVTLDTPPKYQAAYVTVKYALLGLIKSLAAEYADTGIAINGVSPDMIQTKFVSDLPHLLIEQYTQTRPRKQILKVDDVVPTFRFLLSEGAGGINGENIGIR